MIDSIISSPAATLTCLVIAAVLLLIETTPMLPTFGLSGLLGIGLGWIGVAGLHEQQLTWWPLMIAAVGATAAAVLILTRKRLIPVFAAVVGAVAVGTIGTAAIWKDAPAIIVAIVTTVVFAATSWWLIDAARRLLDRPSDVGADAVVGRTAKVVIWDGTAGRVMLDGDTWNAIASHEFPVGATVEVVGLDRLTLKVASV